MKLVHLARTTSTQDDAKRAAADLAAPAEEWTTFVADEQTSGRGRQGRVWSAPAGSALLASVVLRPALQAASLPPLSLVVGLAVADAVALRIDSARVGIKWPNDVHVDGRKLAGVLVEASLRGTRVEHVIAGFGVNLCRSATSGALSDIAISLEEAGAVSRDRDALLQDTVEALRSRVGSYVARGLVSQLDDLRARDVARGRRVQGEFGEGTAVGIADDGRLRVLSGGGELAVSAGDVTFLPR